MLLNNFLYKTIRDQIKSLLWWSIGISIYCSAITFLYSLMENSIKELAAAYPSDIGKVFGIENMSDIASAPGWLNAEMYSFMLPICFIIFAIFAGANSIASEEENRTIEILLSEPLSRGSLFLQKYLVFMLNMFFMTSIICLSVYIPSLIIDMEISIYGIFAATFNVTLISALLGTGSFTIAALYGRRRISLIIPIMISLISYILNIASKFIDNVTSINRLSIFRYYDIPYAFENGVNAQVTLAFSAMMLALVLVGYISFVRRDLRI